MANLENKTSRVCCDNNGGITLFWFRFHFNIRIWYKYIFPISINPDITTSYVSDQPRNIQTLLSKSICVSCVALELFKNGAFSDVITQVAVQRYPTCGNEVRKRHQSYTAGCHDMFQIWRYEKHSTLVVTPHVIPRDDKACYNEVWQKKSVMTCTDLPFVFTGIEGRAKRYFLHFTWSALATIPTEPVRAIYRHGSAESIFLALDLI